MDSIKKRSWAEIYTENIRHNYRAIRSYIGNECRFLGVVKADAYGHGSVEVSKILQEEGADYLAVACLDEAVELRDSGINLPILILGHTPKEYVSTLIRRNITQAVSCLDKAKEYCSEAVKLNARLKIHIKLDTGMSRLGFICSGDYFPIGVDNIIQACSLPGLIHEGIFTHFSVSDEPGTDNRLYTEKQFKLFNDIISSVKEKGNISFEIRHCANSGATLNYPETQLDMVRPGLLLYGYGDPDNILGLKPCMRLVTTVGTIKHFAPGTDISYGRRYTTDRTTRVGVLTIGYADGVHRAISNKCSFAAGSGFAPQLGNICMDMCMVDLTKLPEVQVGSEVELFGEKNSLLQLSDAAGTIPYELLCSVSKRIPRIYV